MGQVVRESFTCPARLSVFFFEHVREFMTYILYAFHASQNYYSIPF